MRGLNICSIILFLFNISSAQNTEYCKRCDYQFNFDSTKATIIQVIINKNQLELPDSIFGFHTAFLEMEIKSLPIIHRSQPFIRLEGNPIKAEQYFEYGVKGVRYVNISEFVQKGIRQISLDALHCRISGQSFRLIMYKNPHVENQRIMVLAPHPDDAEISAYGLYATNKNSLIATITIGDAGKKMYDELYSNDTIHYIKKGDIRLWNSITVPMLAGLNPQNIVNLGYFDASLKTMYSDTTKNAKARYTGMDDINIYRRKNISHLLDSLQGNSNWRSLVNDLKQLVQKQQPTVIVAPYPAIDVHPDHKLTTVALIHALKELDYKNVELWLYTNHFVNDELYPLGKVRSLVSLPPVTSGSPIYFDRIYSLTLSNVLQSDKALALDAMFPLRPDTEWHTTAGSWKLFRKTMRENRRNTETDYYYRRAVRNNELFFIINLNDLKNDSVFHTVIGNLGS
jgi:LmbE family N-acetylglucosaminyl deacetylase